MVLVFVVLLLALLLSRRGGTEAHCLECWKSTRRKPSVECLGNPSIQSSNRVACLMAAGQGGRGGPGANNRKRDNRMRIRVVSRVRVAKGARGRRDEGRGGGDRFVLVGVAGAVEVGGVDADRKRGDGSLGVVLTALLCAARITWYTTVTPCM